MRSYISILILSVFIVTSCQPPNNVPLTTPSLTEILLSTPTLTPIPSATSTKAYGTAETETDIDLPEWITNPKNNLILLAYLTDGKKNEFGFANPQTGEQYKIKPSQNFYHYYWKDSNHVVLLHGKNCEDDPKTITELDIEKGTLKEYQAQNYPGPIQGCYPSSVFEEKTTRLKTDHPESFIEVIDSETGKWIPLTNLNDGISDISWEYSPDRSYVFIIQYKGVYDFPEVWRPIYGDRISVYNTASRQLLGMFDDEMDISTRGLFLDNENFIYIRGNIPCLIMISAMSRSCANRISQEFPDATIVLGDRLIAPWRFGFLYFTDSPHHGSLCFYDFLIGSMDCPMDRFQALSEQTVMIYLLSPDEQYILFEYDQKGCPPPWCDYSINPHLAVVDKGGNQMFELGTTKEIEMLDIFGTSRLWRPTN